MGENEAQDLISTNFPDFKINDINKIGEGTGNVAYEVNSKYIFRFPKKSENQIQLEREISVQKILKTYSPLPIPNFEYLPHDHSFVGYQKLVGDPMINIFKEFEAWDSFSRHIGTFITKLHNIPMDEFKGLDLLTENKSFEDWQNHSYHFYEKTKYLIPEQYIPGIESFFQSTLQSNIGELVFCHNDLGVEHILILDGEVSGIIDWGGAALTDPASDFARLYRDVGEQVLDKVLAEYTTFRNKSEIRNRAIFYGKCLIFEDLFCGLRDEIYLQKSLSALKWMF